MHTIKPQNTNKCNIVLDIEIATDFPDKNPLFITGNLPELGNWDPAGKKLIPLNKNHYKVSLTAQPGTIIEYKLTRGSWKTQGICNKSDVPPSNMVVKALEDKKIPIKIIDWLDQQIIHSDPVQGTLLLKEDLESKKLKFQRKVRIWLPEGYSTESQPHAVIYMHDGQNLFEPGTAFAGVDWKVDETITTLLKQRLIKKCIVVGIDNSPDRMKELNFHTNAGKAYSEFVCSVVKPYIDNNFNVLTNPANTFLMGSSMGGLMSLQMLLARPDVFGGAGCLSSAFNRTYGKLDQWINEMPILPEGIKIYLDTGEYEPPIVRDYFKMLKTLKQKGFREGYNLMGVFDEKTTHCEAAWARRLHYPLGFLLQPNK